MLQPKIGLIVVMSPLEKGADRAYPLFKRAEAVLSRVGLDVIRAGIVSDEKTANSAKENLAKHGAELLCCLAATWAEDTPVLDILARLRLPAVVWAIPGIENGSLCFCHQFCCVMNEMAHSPFFIFGDVDRSRAYRIARFSRAVSVRRRLGEAKLGQLGHRLKGMTEVAFDEMALRETFGTGMVFSSTEALLSRADRIKDKDVKRLWSQTKRQAGSVRVGEQVGLRSMKITLALRDFALKQGLMGIAVECYPDLMGEFCLPFSILSEQGIMGGCEGDVNSTLAMAILFMLTGKPVHNTDLLGPVDGAIVFSHCGSGGFSLARSRQSITLAPVRLKEKGVCALFPARKGDVTLLNIVGRQGTYRMGILEGKALETRMVFPGNPVRVKFLGPPSEVIQWIADCGLGHHWMIGYGDIGEELRHFSRLVGVPSLVF